MTEERKETTTTTTTTEETVKPSKVESEEVVQTRVRQVDHSGDDN